MADADFFKQVFIKTFKFIFNLLKINDKIKYVFSL